MNDCTLIILGATGDLTRRKLIPAIYKLIVDKKINNFIVVGAAIDNTTAAALLSKADQFIENKDPVVWEQLVKNTYYTPVDFSSADDFEKLAALVKKLEAERDLPGNRLVYLATPANFFCSITQHVCDSGLIQKKNEQSDPWHRIVYEKPFGLDAHSASVINNCIAQNLNESQVWRIDHYLSKEIVGNIAMIRFTNCVFEPLWNNRFIDNIQIILSESIGIDGRGSYYDQFGALRDVVQNHMLELVALIAMEAPEKLLGEHIRKERVRVLQKIEVIDGILGQYQGYRQEPGVVSNSTTETFAALKLEVKNPRWAGVPFYLKTGKYLDKKKTVIHIKFKQVDCLLATGCPLDSNYLTIQIDPDAGFSLNLFAKKPGTFNDLAPVKMNFSYQQRFGPLTPEAYENILQEIMKGEHSISIRCDEINYSWKIIDRIRALHCDEYSYEKGSTGPSELKQFERKHGMVWQS